MVIFILLYSLVIAALPCALASSNSSLTAFQKGHLYVYQYHMRHNLSTDSDSGQAAATELKARVVIEVVKQEGNYLDLLVELHNVDVRTRSQSENGTEEMSKEDREILFGPRMDALMLPFQVSLHMGVVTYAIFNKDDHVRSKNLKRGVVSHLQFSTVAIDEMLQFPESPEGSNHSERSPHGHCEWRYSNLTRSAENKLKLQKKTSLHDCHNKLYESLFLYGNVEEAKACLTKGNHSCILNSTAVVVATVTRGKEGLMIWKAESEASYVVDPSTQSEKLTATSTASLHFSHTKRDALKKFQGGNATSLLFDFSEVEEVEAISRRPVTFSVIQNSIDVVLRELKDSNVSATIVSQEFYRLISYLCKASNDVRGRVTEHYFIAAGVEVEEMSESRRQQSLLISAFALAGTPTTMNIALRQLKVGHVPLDVKLTVVQALRSLERPTNELIAQALDVCMTGDRGGKFRETCLLATGAAIRNLCELYLIVPQKADMCPQKTRVRLAAYMVKGFKNSKSESEQILYLHMMENAVLELSDDFLYSVISSVLYDDSVRAEALKIRIHRYNDSVTVNDLKIAVHPEQPFALREVGMRHLRDRLKPEDESWFKKLWERIVQAVKRAMTSNDNSDIDFWQKDFFDFLPWKTLISSYLAVPEEVMETLHNILNNTIGTFSFATYLEKDTMNRFIAQVLFGNASRIAKERREKTGNFNSFFAELMAFWEGAYVADFGKRSELKLAVQDSNLFRLDERTLHNDMQRLADLLGTTSATADEARDEVGTVLGATMFRRSTLIFPTMTGLAVKFTIKTPSVFEAKWKIVREEDAFSTNLNFSARWEALEVSAMRTVTQTREIGAELWKATGILLPLSVKITNETDEPAVSIGLTPGQESRKLFSAKSTERITIQELHSARPMADEIANSSTAAATDEPIIAILPAQELEARLARNWVEISQVASPSQSSALLQVVHSPTSRFAFLARPFTARAIVQCPGLRSQASASFTEASKYLQTIYMPILSYLEYRTIRLPENGNAAESIVAFWSVGPMESQGNFSETGKIDIAGYTDAERDFVTTFTNKAIEAMDNKSYIDLGVVLVSYSIGFTYQTFPVLRVRLQDNTTKFIDYTHPSPWIYEDWSDFLKKANIPPGLICYPKGGYYTPEGTKSEPVLVCERTHECEPLQAVVRKFDENVPWWQLDGAIIAAMGGYTLHPEVVIAGLAIEIPSSVYIFIRRIQYDVDEFRHCGHHTFREYLDDIIAAVPGLFAVTKRVGTLFGAVENIGKMPALSRGYFFYVKAVGKSTIPPALALLAMRGADALDRKFHNGEVGWELERMLQATVVCSEIIPVAKSVASRSSERSFKVLTNYLLHIEDLPPERRTVVLEEVDIDSLEYPRALEEEEQAGPSNPDQEDDDADEVLRDSDEDDQAGPPNRGPNPVRREPMKEDRFQNLMGKLDEEAGKMYKDQDKTMKYYTYLLYDLDGLDIQSMTVDQFKDRVFYVGKGTWNPTWKRFEDHITETRRAIIEKEVTEAIGMDEQFLRKQLTNENKKLIKLTPKQFEALKKRVNREQATLNKHDMGMKMEKIYDIWQANRVICVHVNLPEQGAAVAYSMEDLLYKRILDGGRREGMLTNDAGTWHLVFKKGYIPKWKKTQAGWPQDDQNYVADCIIEEAVLRIKELTEPMYSYGRGDESHYF